MKNQMLKVKWERPGHPGTFLFGEVAAMPTRPAPVHVRAISRIRGARYNADGAQWVDMDSTLLTPQPKYAESVAYMPEDDDKSITFEDLAAL